MAKGKRQKTKDLKREKHLIPGQPTHGRFHQISCGLAHYPILQVEDAENTSRRHDKGSQTERQIVPADARIGVFRRKTALKVRLCLGIDGQRQRVTDKTLAKKDVVEKKGGT
jgi:hypothetical protein